MGLTLSCSELRAGEPIPPELALAVQKLQTEYSVSSKIHREVCSQLGLPSQLFAIDGATARAGAGTGTTETNSLSHGGAGTKSTNKHGKSGITKAGKKAAAVLASPSAACDKNSNKKNP